MNAWMTPDRIRALEHCRLWPPCDGPIPVMCVWDACFALFLFHDDTGLFARFESAESAENRAEVLAELMGLASEMEVTDMLSALDAVAAEMRI
jgi:hypothetical protein